jgi:hypothetical protein
MTAPVDDAPGLSAFLALELAEAWEIQAELEAGASADRRATLRECADMVRMLATRGRLGERP